MASLPFGEAVAPGQLVATCASFLIWLAVERRLTGPLLSHLFGADRWASCSAEQRYRLGISVASFLFASVAVVVGACGLLFPPPAVQADPIYGRSELVQKGAAMVVGFFAWNLVAENTRAWAGWANAVHHMCCLVCFVFVQYPFGPRIGCASMLFEASTPALCTFNILRNLGLEQTPLYRMARVWFAILFFLFRLGLGFPLTALWYSDMMALAADETRQVHSVPVFYASLALPIPFLAVNVFWFGLIVKHAVRKEKAHEKH